MQTDYNILTQSDFEHTIKNYLVFKLMNGIGDADSETELDDES
jgi:hypothetical protein